MSAEQTRSMEYRKLCTLAIFHEYYNEAISADGISLQITSSMHQLCRNEGLLIQQKGQYITVLHDRSSMDEAVGDIWLHIGVRFTDADFFNFSDAGLNSPDSVLLCSNQTVRSLDGIEYLHDGDYIDASHSQSISKCDPEIYTERASLIVSLNLKELINQSTDQVSPTPYVIRFAARQVSWLYWFWLKQGKLKNVIDNKNDVAGLGVQLSDGLSNTNSAMDFKQLDDLVEVNQQHAIRFISPTPIKLSADSNSTLSLVYQGPMGEKTLLDNLPHPSMDCLELLVIDNEKQIVASSHVSL